VGMQYERTGDADGSKPLRAEPGLLSAGVVDCRHVTCFTAACTPHQAGQVTPILTSSPVMMIFCGYDALPSN
jgi:hypothetical protein